MRVHHVNLVVPAGLVDDTAGFWVAVFGATPVERHGRSPRPGAWLKAGDAEIHLSERDVGPHSDAHVCFVVDDFESARASALELGAEWDEIAPPAGFTRRAFTRDPGGNRVEIFG